jgi:hypothetical protein
VICPLCGQRKARRACPALNKQICAICCGTKRLVQINCPADCVYLATSREHPAAAVVRQHQRDIGLVVQSMRDLNQRQSQIFLLVTTFLVRYEPPELQPLIDDDVSEAAAALAATLETSSRGVIYEHRPASLPAERLMSALKPLLAEAGQHAGSSFDRDAAVVLRRIEDAARDARGDASGNRRALIETLGRVITKTGDGPAPMEAPDEPTRLIVP